ncbi:MAG: Bifunctional protein FolC [Candidatus Saccharibacteria bacterium]|nr:Bifunctional protein FolC [Candidatus Saccharibacteria bacterium]
MMRYLKNFSDVHEALSRYIPLVPSSKPYTLDTIKKLMDYLGNPQDQLKVIHVAGTSGKTSTAYYLAALLDAAGYTTGLTVSPHIDEINDRTQINLQPLPEKEYCAEIAEFLDLVDASGLQPSHFEVLVAFSYWEFHKKQVDYAVVEVGLGGLLDGTNVVNRADKVCVITDIGLDHVDVLGDTLDKIAAQKAGIIQTSNTVFINKQPSEIMDVIRETVVKKQAELNVVEQQLNSGLEYLPTFQQRNFSLAVHVITTTIDKTLTDSQIQEAAHAYIPARMEIVSYRGKTLVMDGAHNEQKITALVQAMKQRFPDQSIGLLVSFGQNKQSSVKESFEILRQLGDAVIITTFKKGQDEIRLSMDIDELAEFAKQAGFTNVTTEPDQLKALNLLEQSNNAIGLIAGSFYLLESYRPHIFIDKTKR